MHLKPWYLQGNKHNEIYALFILLINLTSRNPALMNLLWFKYIDNDYRQIWCSNVYTLLRLTILYKMWNTENKFRMFEKKYEQFTHKTDKYI